MSDRITAFEPAQLSPEARAVYERILAERGYVPGPYRFWLACPGFADRMEPLEAFLRYQISLDERQIETIVLTVARHWKAQYVWSSHEPAALKAGLQPAVVQAIQSGRPPEFERSQDRVCYTLCQALLETHEVADTLWSEALSVLGEAGVNELLGLLGLYTSACLTMVAYRMPPRDGAANPLD